MARTYYAERLAAFDWAGIRAACDAVATILRDDPTTDEADGGVAGRYGRIPAHADRADDDGTIRACVYLGRGYHDCPSGSFYAPWSAVPDRVRERDAAWWEAFERAARRYGLDLDAGEGDPTDTYAVLYIHAED